MTPRQMPLILFLTTANPAEIKAEWPFYQNWTLPEAMRIHGADVSIRSWRDDSLDIPALAKFNVITFLWCNDYHRHGPALSAFIKTKLIPAQSHKPSLRISNDPHLVLWNMDKQTYLPALRDVGFHIPHTEILDSLSGPAAHANLLSAVRSYHSKPIVLKPSVSGSSKGTYLIRYPLRLSSADNEYLDYVIKNGTDGALLIQEYEPAIERGEYSLIFINSKHTHTILKIPQAGEFRCQGEFGGGTAEIALADVPMHAMEVALKVFAYMQSKFSNRVDYARVDGVVREDGRFVLMEIEAIEPHLWLETASDANCKIEIYSSLLGRRVTNAVHPNNLAHRPSESENVTSAVESLVPSTVPTIIQRAVHDTNEVDIVTFKAGTSVETTRELLINDAE